MQAFWKMLFAVLILTSIQIQAADDINLKKVSEAELRTEAIIEAKTSQQFSREGETPLSTMIAISEAIQKNDWQKASRFVDLRYLPDNIRQEDAPDLIRKLNILWKKKNIIDLSQISDLPSGHSNDNLPPYRDLLGVLETEDGPIPIYLQLVPDGKSGKIWKISNATISKVPMLWEQYGYPPQIEALANFLPQVTIFHMDNWQALIFFISIFLGWIVAGFVSMAAQSIAKIFESKLKGITQFCGRSLHWFVYLMLLQNIALALGLSVRARVWFENGTLIYLAFTILALGVIELFANYKAEQFQTKKNNYSIALLRPVVAIVKILIIIVGILMWFESSGYNMATILTGLGVGSLAIALAAQKPLENVFGAFTIYASKPINPGDFCRFGDVKGTVEEIGLRSTRVRKLDRSVVHIPNSVFSSKELENFSVIDRRRFKQDLRISLATPKEQIQVLLIELRKLLAGHPKVLDVGQRARFLAIERDAFLIKINAYIDTGNVITYFGIAEDLNFHILTILTELNIQIAPAGQHVVLTPYNEPNVAIQQQAAATMAQMIAAEEMPFPNFSKETKATLKDSVQYPRLAVLLMQRKKQPSQAKMLKQCRLTPKNNKPLYLRLNPIIMALAVVSLN
ncbi:mechanosensitive ion channel family protein [Shewanella aestuarii]|uniref:Mechanosensitive ion channel family protein n=1 Tax=Shewanella aestuarii TaxID=1028752 RepID=A0A6G9QHQ9_9GAMM|nr:mechanosensitive ion channel family protein [Shewanella aestuarii]QIR13431.1 mechanosensitive ion channel family protein [Shewanella aestuarii]